MSNWYYSLQELLQGALMLINIANLNVPQFGCCQQTVIAWYHSGLIGIENRKVLLVRSKYVSQMYVWQYISLVLLWFVHWWLNRSRLSHVLKSSMLDYKPGVKMKTERCGLWPMLQKPSHYEPLHAMNHDFNGWCISTTHNNVFTFGTHRFTFK